MMMIWDGWFGSFLKTEKKKDLPQCRAEWVTEQQQQQQQQQQQPTTQHFIITLIYMQRRIEDRKVTVQVILEWSEEIIK